MATSDVPGANPANKDTLHEGCWAEHEDGSLIHVKGMEGAPTGGTRVIFDVYDPERKIVYTHVMEEVRFKKEFSWQPRGKSKIKWTWHDKSDFPWVRVNDMLDRPIPLQTAAGVMTSAARVAEDLDLLGRQLAEEEVSHKVETTGKKAGFRILDRLGRAIRELGR